MPRHLRYIAMSNHRTASVPGTLHLSDRRTMRRVRGVLLRILRIDGREGIWSRLQFRFCPWLAPSEEEYYRPD